MPATTKPPQQALVFLATGFGLARLTPAGPGTVGALLGLGLTAALHAAAGLLPPALASLLLPAAAAALLAAGVPICAAGQRRFGQKDPAVVVWDEMATMPMVFLFLPPAKISLGVLLVGFALHRLFDILKPPPCRRLERLRGGWGVMADDAAAAVYACIVLHVLLWFKLAGG